MRRELELCREFGEYVRCKRLGKGLSLRETARVASMSPTYLSQIERGEQRWPTEQKLLDLANALGLDGDDLMWRAGRIPGEILELVRATSPQKRAAMLKVIKRML